MNRAIERFEDLIAWQKARELTREVYQITQRGAFGKDFGLNQKARDWHTPPGHEVSGLRDNAGSSQLASPIDGALLCSPAINRRADEENLLFQNVRISCVSI